MNRMFQMQLKTLSGGAARGTDPAVYYTLILDTLPEGQQQQLVDFLKRPDWFAQITAAVPAIATQQLWFDQLRNLLLGTPGAAPAV